MVKRYGTSSMECESGIYVLHAEYEKLVAELDALLSELRTPQFTHVDVQRAGSLVGDGLSRDAAFEGFCNYPGALVTVFYGRRKVFADMAAFDAAANARDCSKCGAKEVPANRYCKGIDCPLNPATEKA